MFAVTAAKFTAEGTASVLIDRCIRLSGCPRSILSGNGLQFCSKISYAVDEFLGVRKSPPAPATRAVMVVWSVSTTQWRKCWLWSSTSAKTIGMRNYPTWNSPTTILSAPPLVSRFTWAGSRASLILFLTASGLPAIRACPRPPRILRPGVGMPTGRQRYCSRIACFDCFSRGTAQLSPFGRLRQVPNVVVGN